MNNELTPSQMGKKAQSDLKKKLGAKGYKEHMLNFQRKGVEAQLNNARVSLSERLGRPPTDQEVLQARSEEMKRRSLQRRRNVV